MKPTLLVIFLCSVVPSCDSKSSTPTPPKVADVEHLADRLARKVKEDSLLERDMKTSTTTVVRTDIRKTDSVLHPYVCDIVIRDDYTIKTTLPEVFPGSNTYTFVVAQTGADWKLVKFSVDEREATGEKLANRLWPPTE